jgi:hypothetical protein
MSGTQSWTDLGFGLYGQPPPNGNAPIIPFGAPTVEGGIGYADGQPNWGDGVQNHPFTGEGRKNVRMYGARATFGVDDRAAFQAAIDDRFANGGGIVPVPPGFYYIGAPGVILRSGVILAGDGDASQLIPFPSSTTPMIDSLVGIPLYDAGVRDLLLNGETVLGLTGTNHGIRLQNPSRCRIANVRVRRMGGDGITIPISTVPNGLEGHVNWIGPTNHIELCLGHGISIFGAVNHTNPDVAIFDSEIGGSGYSAWPDPSGYGTGGTSDGLHLVNTGGSHKIRGNHIHQSSQYGYYCGGAGDCLFVENLSEKSVKQGMVFASSARCVVGSNFIRQVDVLAAGGIDGLTIVDSDGLMVNGNVITGGRYGIAVTSSGPSISKNSIGPNQCDGYTTAPVFFQNPLSNFGNAPAGAVYGFKRVLTTTVATAIAPILNNAVGTFTVALTGTALDDTVTVSITNLGAVGVLVSAWVSVAGTIQVVIHNLSGGTLTLGTQAVRVDVFQHV